VCACQRSFESSCSPRIRTIGDGAITILGIRTGASRSKQLLWVKCARMYFCGANLILCVAVQAKHRPCADSRAVQFTAVNSLYVKRFMSFAKPRAEQIGVGLAGSVLLVVVRRRRGRC
jgi:hypothetical protein